MKKTSVRFQPSPWMKWLVPALLVLILLGLAASTVIIIISLIGVIPA